MRGSTTPTLPGGPSRPPWTPSGATLPPWALGLATLSPLHRDQEPSCSVDHEQRALRSPLRPLIRGVPTPEPRPGFRPRRRPKVRCRLSLWKPIDPSGAGTLCAMAGHAARGTREEGWRADRLRCTAWLARDAHLRSRIARPQRCGTSSLRASATPASRSMASSRALSLRVRPRAPGQSLPLTAPRQRRCWRRPLPSPTGWRVCLKARKSETRRCAPAARNCSSSVLS